MIYKFKRRKREINEKHKEINQLLITIFKNKIQTKI